jgi:hypothetical protein
MDQPLFPLSALQTKGYAQPEPRDDETVTDETAAEADTEAEAA